MHLSASRFRNAVAILAAAGLTAACQLPFGSIPASERAPVETREAETRDEGEGLLTGLFTRRPADLPDAVPIPVREATVERGYGGAILRATGVAPTQGWFNGALVAADGGRLDAAGVMTVSLVAVPPPVPGAVGPERTRLLLVGAFLSERELRDVRAFRLVAANQTVTLPVR